MPTLPCHPNDGDNYYGNDPPECSQQPPELTVSGTTKHYGSQEPKDRVSGAVYKDHQQRDPVGRPE